MRSLRKILGGFVAIALLLLGLQYIPLTGFILSMFLGWYWIGILMHGALLAIVVLAIIDRVPRWSMALPFAVWIGGLVWWQLGLRSADDAAQALKRPQEIAAGDRPIVVKGDRPLAEALAANYVSGPVHSEFFSHTSSEGPECTPSKAVDPNRQVLAIPGGDRCIVSVRAEPPNVAIEIRVTPNAGLTPSGGTMTRIDIRDATQASTSSSQLEMSEEPVPLPVLLPLVGFVHGSNSERQFLFELARTTRVEPRTSSTTTNGSDRYAASLVAAALKLRER